MSRPILGLALIARDEEDTLPRLLASGEGAFDQVALLDTGSVDRTVEVFEEWSAAEKERQPGFVSTLGQFEWCDDFAAARNATDDLLETDWWCNADSDDVIDDAGQLRRLVASLPRGINGVRFPYEWSRGLPWIFPPAQRPRLVRRGFSRWRYRVHEHQVIMGDGCDLALPRWHHAYRTSAGWLRSCERNIRILQRWCREEPDNAVPASLLRVERGAYEELLVAIRGAAGAPKSRQVRRAEARKMAKEGLRVA